LSRIKVGREYHYTPYVEPPRTDPKTEDIVDLLLELDNPEPKAESWPQDMVERAAPMARKHNLEPEDFLRSLLEPMLAAQESLLGAA
jgi:hypothetical protein